MQLTIKPDWCKIYTAAEAEADLNNFKFKGPGWYITNLDSLLVIPLLPNWTGHAWKQKWGKKQKFMFYCFSGPYAGFSFGEAARAPIRYRPLQYEFVAALGYLIR